MRDRTASRHYSAAGEEFRREHQRHRAWGKRHGHIHRLRELRGCSYAEAAAVVDGVHRAIPPQAPQPTPRSGTQPTPPPETQPASPPETQPASPLGTGPGTQPGMCAVPPHVTPPSAPYASDTQDTPDFFPAQDTPAVPGAQDVSPASDRRGLLDTQQTRAPAATHELLDAQATAATQDTLDAQEDPASSPRRAACSRRRRPRTASPPLPARHGSRAIRTGPQLRRAAAASGEVPLRGPPAGP